MFLANSQLFYKINFRFNLVFLELEKSNNELKKQVEGESSSKSTDQSDKIVRRYGFFLSHGAANGLTVYLMTSGKYAYITTDNKFNYLDSKSTLLKSPNFNSKSKLCLTF